MVKKINLKRAGFLLTANLAASDEKVSQRKRAHEAAARKQEEGELPAEKAPRKQRRWLEEERRQTQLPRHGHEAAQEERNAADTRGRGGRGGQDLDEGDGVVGRKKAKRLQVLSAKKAREAAKKTAAGQRAHAEALEALKGKAALKPGSVAAAAADLLSRCRRDRTGERRLLALVAEKVAGNPEKDLELFDLFFELHLNGCDETIKTIALLSAIAVFKDLVPSYRIREPTETEKSQQRSKGVLALEKYEMSLLLTYRRLLPALEVAMKRDAAKFANALSALVKAAADFNYRQRLIATAVRYANGPDAEVRRVVAGGLQEMVEADQRLDASKELVLAVGHIAQATAAGRGRGLQIELLQVLLRLQVGRAEAAALQQETGALKEADEEVRQGLNEASITQSPDHLRKAEALLLYEVFCVYLRILRQRHLHGRQMLSSVLVGLARWGQQVNLELLLEILQELRHTVQDAISQCDELVALQGLNCALVLLSGPSQALITDATWLSDSFSRALALALPSLHSTHSESGAWPPARCYSFVDGKRLQARKKELEEVVEAESIPCLVLRALENALRCPHGFGRASDGVLALLLETLFVLAAVADCHVGLALAREASSILKKSRRLHTILDTEGGLFGLGGITDRAVSIAWQLHPLACSLAPATARVGRDLADVVRSRRALLSDLFPQREALSWLEGEFPHHLVALLEAPKPGSQSFGSKAAVSFSFPEESRRRLCEG